MTVGPAGGDHGVVPPDPAADRFRSRIAAAGRPALVALLAGTVTLALSLVAFVAILVEPHDGTVVTSPRSQFEDGGIRLSDARDSQLRSGDVVLSVDGIAVDELARRPFTEHLAVNDRDTLTYEVRRGETVTSVDVSIDQRDAHAVVGSNWSGAVLVPVLAAIGAFLLWRRPDVAAARTMYVVGAFAVLSWVLATHGPSPIDLAAGRWWFLFGGLALYVCEVGLLHFVVVLTDDPEPSERELTRRRRRLALLVTGAAILYAADALAGAAATSSSIERLGALFFPRLEPLVVLATVAVAVVRYRRASNEITRRQLRLIAWQLVVAGAVYIALFALPDALGGDTLLPMGLAAVPFWSFPPVLAIAVLRFDLFEIRFLVHRSVLYVSLTAIVAAIYVALVAGISAITGRGAGLGASAIAAGVVAVAFHPLRVRLQRGVDRLVYGTAAEPAEVLAELGRRLEDRGQPDAMLDTVVETVARSLGRSFVAIEVGEGDERDVVAMHGERSDEQAEVPLVHQGRVVGHLVVGLPPNATEIGPAEQRLLTGVAAHVGTAVAAARLTVDLQRSRERLVGALEDERRRLGRDLHDGLGPRLAGASMKLEAAGRMARRDLDAALVLHDEVRSELNDVISELRRIVYALRPASLDQLGLVGALREQANRLAGHVNGSASIELLVDVRGNLPELPAAVEIAAYRIASEAMTNAVRHAAATRCEVVLAAGRDLEVAVVDDGRGIPEPLRAGVGVTSMRERADEIGGTMSVRRGPACGTIVLATLPLEPRG